MMECYCEPVEGEPCEVWIETWRVARKPHICIECKAQILPGERYQHVFFKLDIVESFKTCEFCVGEWARIQRDTDMCRVPGELACAVVFELREKEAA